MIADSLYGHPFANLDAADGLYGNPFAILHEFMRLSTCSPGKKCPSQ